MESKVKTVGVKIEHQPDGSYYNTGSCVHPLCITGIEITFENGPHLCLIEQAHDLVHKGGVISKRLDGVLGAGLDEKQLTEFVSLCPLSQCCVEGGLTLKGMSD